MFETRMLEHESLMTLLNCTAKLCNPDHSLLSMLQFQNNNPRRLLANYIIFLLGIASYQTLFTSPQVKALSTSKLHQ